MEDSYVTIEGQAYGEFKDKGSKFQAYAQSISDEDDVKLFLSEIKKLHPKGRHHCFSYRIGLDKNRYRANDDGEPSGTAGRPILGQIDSFGLTNIMVIVVRYFGGTKLGVPGLINAYKTATIEALNTAQTIEKTVDVRYSITFDYDIMSNIMGFLKKQDINIINQEFAEKAILKVEIRKGDLSKIEEDLPEHINPYGKIVHDLEIKELE